MIGVDTKRNTEIGQKSQFLQLLLEAASKSESVPVD